MDEKRQSADKVGRPRSHDNAVSVAYLRIMGRSQVYAAEAVGVSTDAIQRWEASSWWPEILAEASSRWLAGLEAKARTTLLSGLDPTLSLKVLERRMPELAPATTRTDVTTDGKPLDSLTIRYVDTPNPDDD